MLANIPNLILGALALTSAIQPASATGAIVSRHADKHGACGNRDGKIYFAPRADVTITIQAGKMKRCKGPKERYTIKRQHMNEVRWHTQNSVVNTDCRFGGTFTDKHGTVVFDFLDSDAYLQPGYTGVSNGVRIVCGI